MNITVKHNRKNFFGSENYTEDIKQNADFNDLKKAFSALKKDHNFAVQIDNYCLIWNTITDFEHGSLTCYEYEAANSRNEYLWSFESCKKYFYSMFKD